MNCPNCGSSLADGVTTCPSCGASISQQPSYGQGQYQQYQSGYGQYQQNYGQNQYQQNQQSYDQTQYQQNQPNYGQTQYQQGQQTYGQTQYQQDYSQYQQGYGQAQYQQNYNQYQQTGYKPAHNFNAASLNGGLGIGQYAILAGNLIGLISVFLPFASASAFGYKQSVALIDGSDGWLFLIAALLVAGLSFLKKDVLNVVLTAIYAILALAEMGNANDLKRSYGRMMKYGAGYYLLIFGSFVALAGAIYTLVMHKKAKKQMY